MYSIFVDWRLALSSANLLKGEMGEKPLIIAVGILHQQVPVPAFLRF